jgi:ABC-2 type transport system permease protein
VTTSASAGTPPLAAPLRPIPLRARLYGLGSIYGKTLRDSRRAFIIMTGLIAGLMLAAGAQWVAYGTPEARHEYARLLEVIPPILAGLAGPVVNPETMGGFLTHEYGPQFGLITGLWSILALSGTLAAEARRGSLDFVAVAPFDRRRIAIEKLAAHVTAMALSMVFLVLATLVASRVFGVPELGDEISLAGAGGYALWAGLMGLVSGAVAFALAPLVGRGGAAGVAGAVLLGSVILGGYAPHVPQLEPLAVLSWFHWTYGHAPLAGQYDWGSLAPVGLATVALFAVGIELFARRDLGMKTGPPIPGLPRATLGVGGPVGRAFGDQLPVALAWGLGIGLFGFLMAAISHDFLDEMTREFPVTVEFIRGVFPGVDMASPGWFLQLVFVEMGLIVVGFAAATFVARWASDEESGRLEVLLASSLTRARWVVAGGVGALAAAAATTVVIAAGIALGSALGGGEVVTPTLGSLALFAYTAAAVGIGIAIGGLWRTAWAPELVAAFVVATFLVDLLAPALDLPDWVAHLALTTHLGQPMVGAWDWGGLALCAAIAVGGILMGARGMTRRDVA